MIAQAIQAELAIDACQARALARQILNGQFPDLPSSPQLIDQLAQLGVQI